MELYKEVNFNRNYLISNKGNVISKNYNHTGKPKQLIGIKQNNGYLTVNINNKLHCIHRIVAETFIPNPYNKPQVNHKNGIKTDNRVENLEWCSASENTKHAVNNNLIRFDTPSRKKSNLKNISKATESIKKKIIQYDKQNNYINTFNSIIEASKKTNTNATHISLCAKGKQKSCGGYIWRYSND